VLLLGRIVLDFVPTPLLGSLLVWIGAALTYQWLILSVRRLPLWEYLIVVLIFLVIVLVSFTTGIFVGLVAAVILFVVEYGRIDGIRLVLTGRDYQSTFEASEERRERLRLRGSAILIVRLQGFLFFGSSDRLRKNIQERLNGETRFLLIDFKHVTGIDSSAVASFVRLSQLAARGGFTVVLTAMNDTVSRALLRGGLVAGQALRIDRDLDHGLVWCENELLAEETGAGEPRGLTDLAFGIVGDRALASQLGEYFEPASLEPGEFLVEGGLPSDDMFFVGSGRGAVIIAGTANVPVRVATVGPGAIVGEIAFFLDRPRNASVVVETPMTAWRLSRAGLARLQRERPDLAFRFHEGIAAMMAARITSTNRLVVFLAD
jgi:SulP family sulfate permease